MASDNTPHTHFTRPTTYSWQSLLPPGPAAGTASSDHEPPYTHTYPALLPTGQVLELPIRELPLPRMGTETESGVESGMDVGTEVQFAVASLLISHASFAVSDTLERCLVQLLRRFGEEGKGGKGGVDVEVVVGLPTLGLGPAGSVARGLGLDRYIPLGYSRKFWYDDKLSTLISSITSPDGEKRVYLDPNLLELVRGKKVVIVDDAVSSGKTLNAIWNFLTSPAIGCEVVAAGVLMKQGLKWRDVLGEERARRVVGVF
ncbi:hypothetical protein LSUB1_G007146 [Lachnellula subtilissima]|uniref:Phosphoribosyltransferase domain-containing protein n=1 Tax=Lachnellula subtilissima TaxID=602034 RepID=A0A8H8U787_9HELO|nr:hypothetical protein LSUB1_G007146 [Lachnellula subtilissima]